MIFQVDHKNPRSSCVPSIEMLKYHDFGPHLGPPRRPKNIFAPESHGGGALAAALGPQTCTPFIYRLDVQAALKRGLYFVIIVDSFFLIPASLRQILASLLLHHSARFPRPSAKFVLPSARFLILDS